MKHLTLSFFALAMMVEAAYADALVPARTIRAKSIIMYEDLVMKPTNATGAIASYEMLVGKEARVALYAGRPIRAQDIGPPAIVDRNQIVKIIYVGPVMTIATEGRALDRAAGGERIRVMNLSSKTTIFGTVSPDGSVIID